MRTWSAERLGALAGLGFVVLALIGGFIAGSPPKFNDSPAKVAAFFQDHHRSILVGTILSGLSAPLFAWLFASLAAALRRAGQGTLAAVVLAGAAGGIALATASDALYQVDAQVVRSAGGGAFVKGAWQTSGFLTAKAFWFAAVVAVVLALAAWRGAPLPGWYTWVNLAAAVLFALGGVALKQGGFFAPMGGMTFIAFVALLVWGLATSFVLWQVAPAEEAAAPATAPM